MSEEEALNRIADAIRENAEATRDLTEQLRRFSALDRNVLEVRVTGDSKISVKKD